MNGINSGTSRQGAVRHKRRKTSLQAPYFIGTRDSADLARLRSIIRKHHRSWHEAAKVMFVVALLELDEAPLGVVYSLVPLPDDEDGRVPSSQVARSLKSLGLIAKGTPTTSPLPSCNSGVVNTWRLVDRKRALTWLREAAPWVARDLDASIAH